MFPDKFTDLKKLTSITIGAISRLLKDSDPFKRNLLKNLWLVMRLWLAEIPAKTAFAAALAACTVFLFYYQVQHTDISGIDEDVTAQMDSSAITLQDSEANEAEEVTPGGVGPAKAMVTLSLTDEGALTVKDALLEQEAMEERLLDESREAGSWLDLFLVILAVSSFVYGIRDHRRNKAYYYYPEEEKDPAELAGIIDLYKPYLKKLETPRNLKRLVNKIRLQYNLLLEKKPAFRESDGNEKIELFGFLLVFMLHKQLLLIDDYLVFTIQLQEKLKEELLSMEADERILAVWSKYSDLATLQSSLVLRKLYEMNREVIL